LIFCKALDIEGRPNQPLFFASKPNEDERVLSRGAGQLLKEAWKQRSAAPVIDNSLAYRNMVKVSSYNNRRLRWCRVTRRLRLVASCLAPAARTSFQSSIQPLKTV
jgi:hypothetical protein